MAKASRAVWAKRVERWQDSGLTAKEFAAELDVSPKSLTFWKWKLRRAQEQKPARTVDRQRERPAAAVSTTFVELVPTAAKAPGRDGSLELRFPSGVVLRVPKDFDEPTLTRLVGVLGGC